MITNSVHEIIKHVRMDLHLSQEYVANFLNVDKNIIDEMETGKRNISAEELEKFSILFQIPVIELLNSRISIDDDQREILNMIEFKKMIKARGKN